MMKYFESFMCFQPFKKHQKTPKNTIKTIQEITKEINIIKQKKINKRLNLNSEVVFFFF